MVFSREILQEEEYFRKRYRKVIRESKGFKYEKGSTGILFSAPHATAHIREGKIKQEDAWTGAMARVLHRHADVHILYSTCLSAQDPNNTFESEYKERIASIVKRHNVDILFDLHGMAYRDESGKLRSPVCYGIGKRGETVLPRIDLVNDFRLIMKERGIDVCECNLYRASDERRVVQFASSVLKLKAMQIEIREDLRNPLVKSFPNINNLMEGFLQYINHIK